MKKVKKKLDVENAFANDGACGMCITCYFVPGFIALALAGLIIVGDLVE